jgi:hypothetical protein
MISHMRVKERRSGILVLMLLIVTLTLGVTISSALADSDKRVVKVMTQNMDAGTDLLYFFVEDQGSAIQDTYYEIVATDFSGRAELLAEEISI